MLAAGDLDRRVTILNPTSSQNGAGETVTAYADGATVWAQVRQASALESIRNGDTTAQAGYAIRIRWREGVSEANRLRYDGRVLETSKVIEGWERRVELQIVAHEVKP